MRRMIKGEEMRILIMILFSFSVGAEYPYKASAEYAGDRKCVFNFKMKIKNISRKLITDNQFGLLNFDLEYADGRHIGSRSEGPLTDYTGKDIKFKPGEVIERTGCFDFLVRQTQDVNWAETTESGRVFIFTYTVESWYGYFQSSPLKFKVRKQ